MIHSEEVPKVPLLSSSFRMEVGINPTSILHDLLYAFAITSKGTIGQFVPAGKTKSFNTAQPTLVQQLNDMSTISGILVVR